MGMANLGLGLGSRFGAELGSRSRLGSESGSGIGLGLTLTLGTFNIGNGELLGSSGSKIALFNSAAKELRCNDYFYWLFTRHQIKLAASDVPLVDCVNLCTCLINVVRR